MAQPSVTVARRWASPSVSELGQLFHTHTASGEIRVLRLLDRCTLAEYLLICLAVSSMHNFAARPCGVVCMRSHVVET
jgi:hypothetical protein